MPPLHPGADVVREQELTRVASVAQSQQGLAVLGVGRLAQAILVEVALQAKAVELDITSMCSQRALVGQVVGLVQLAEVHAARIDTLALQALS